jgi:hypothetical protein
MAYITGFDVDSLNKTGFDFKKAYAQGYRVAMVKFGGMNLAGNAPYMMNGYHAFVDAAVDAGFKTVVDYIVTGGSNPEAAAKYWLANRHGAVVAHELDNETLDYGNTWTDGQACAYFDAVKPSGVDRWMYGSRDALWKAGAWGGIASRKIKAHIAFYNGSPFTNINPGNYPTELILGHQWTSSASIGGLTAVDADAFAVNAFTPTKTRRHSVSIGKATSYSWGPVFLFGPGYVRHIPNASQLATALAMEGISAPVNLNAQGIKNAIYNYSIRESLDAVIELSIRRDANGKVLGYDKGGYIIAPWADVANAPGASLTDAQVTSIAQQIAAATPKPPTKGTISLEA